MYTKEVNKARKDGYSDYDYSYQCKYKGFAQRAIKKRSQIDERHS